MDLGREPRSGGRGWNPLSAKSLKNRRKYALDVTHHINVIESQDSIAFRFQKCGALPIIFSLVKMRSAIQFNHEFLSRSAEICDVYSDGMLASKSDTGQAVSPQSRP